MAITFNGWIPTDGVILASKYNSESYTSDEISVVQDPEGGKDLVAKLILRAGDGQVASGYRTEISPVSASRQAIEAEYWYAFSIRPPTSTPLGEKVTIWQFHDDGAEPPMWFAEMMGDGSLFISKNTITLPTTGTLTPMRWRIPRPSGWMNFVVRVYWSIDPALGRIDIYLNGSKIISETGTNTYDVGGDNYFKTGSYWGDASMPSTGEWVTYSKGLIVGTGYLTYTEFITAAGLPWDQFGVSSPAEKPTSAWIRVASDRATASSLTLADADSVSFLAAVLFVPSGAQQVMIGDNNTSFEFAVSSTNALRMEFKTDAAANRRAQVNNTVSQPVNDSRRWYWFAGSCDFSSGEMTFWIDGGKQSTSYVDTQAGFVPMAGGANVNVAARPANSLVWRGGIGGIWILKDRIVTDVDVREWYETGFIDNPTVWYKFNESSGNLIDYGSAGLNASWQVGGRTYFPQPAARALATRTTATRTTAKRTVCNRTITA